MKTIFSSGFFTGLLVGVGLATVFFLWQSNYLSPTGTYTSTSSTSVISFSSPQADESRSTAALPPGQIRVPLRTAGDAQSGSRKDTFSAAQKTDTSVATTSPQQAVGLTSVSTKGLFRKTPSVVPSSEKTVASKPIVFASNTSSHHKSDDEKDALRQQCRAKYGSRGYLGEKNRRLPPILYTFPGSGNTWCRLLIEYATGIYTGSVYNDDSLLEPLPGEFTCNWQVSAVKVHPHTHHFSDLRSGTFSSDENKCKRGNVLRFERAIILLRDPFDSIWSEFQRRISQSHVAGVRRDRFNWHRWQANAASLSHAYMDMWTIEHDAMERSFKPQDYLYLRYEDLKSKDKRVAALREIVRFLHLSSNAEQAEAAERLECAFLLAENKKAHRIVDESLYMTKDVAYRPEIACRMWALFGSYAAKHGYRPWKDLPCQDAPKIPRINVGPQGEYDRKWVKPGAKLVDFRVNVTAEQRLVEQQNIKEALREERQKQKMRPGGARGGSGGGRKRAPQKPQQVPAQSSV